MLVFLEKHILQQLGEEEKKWAVHELLETPDPFPGEPLALRNEAMKRAVEMAEEQFNDLSEYAKQRYYFWKLLQPQRIGEQTYRYTTKVTDTYHWELTVNSEGLFYKDVSGEFWHPPGKVTEQLFSNFWFYGPLMPIPELDTRKWMITHIRDAFMQVAPLARQHFPIIEYPPLENSFGWEEGDHNVKDMVYVRSYGIDYSNWNWHDGVVGTTYLSFEHFLTLPPTENKWLTPAMRTRIQAHLSKPIAESRPNPSPSMDATKAESKRLFMANGGRIPDIGRDGDMPNYNGTAADEASWRQELIEQYNARLFEEDNESVLSNIVASLKYNGAEGVEERLLGISQKSSSIRQKQAIAFALAQEFNHEKSVDVLLEMLALEAQDSYWRDHIFGAFTRMRKNPAVRRFLVQCLNGDNEMHFKKTVDVLQNWGYRGEFESADRALLSKLNWGIGGPDFQGALSKIIKILERNK